MNGSRPRNPPRNLPETEVASLLDDLASDDYTIWNEAVLRLGGCGNAVLPPLVAAMRSHSHDPEFCTRAGMALKAVGPRRGRRLVDALDEVNEPLALQTLVEVIGALGEKSMIYRLKDLIERVSGEPIAGNGFDPMSRVRAMAHLELARIGSRVAIQNLRGALADPTQRVELELVAAVELIGKREEIPLLLRAHAREDTFVQERVADAVRAIMKRERIRRNARFFHGLGPDLRRTLRAILPPAADPGSARRERPAR